MPEARRDMALLTGIVRSAASAFTRCWPALLTVYLLAAAARGLLLWAAVLSTRRSSWFGELILPLAPVSILLGLVVMLHLAGLEVPGSDPRQRFSPWAMAPLLVPFLAIYADEGLLDADSRTYLHDITADAVARGGVNGVTPDRYGPDLGLGLLLLVGIALVLRRVLQEGVGRSGRRLSKMLLVALLYVEAVWVVDLASRARHLVGRGESWVGERQLVSWVAAGWSVIADNPLGAAMGAVIAWLWHHALGMATLIVLPMAWLTVANGVRRVDAEAELGDSSLPVPSRLARRWDAAGRRWRRPVVLVSPAADPVRELLAAAREVMRAGVAPMVVFCVLFVLVTQLSVLIAWIARRLSGPRSGNQFLELMPYIHVVEVGVPLLFLAPLAMAAVHAITPDAERTTPAHPLQPAPIGEPPASPDQWMENEA